MRRIKCFIWLLWLFAVNAELTLESVYEKVTGLEVEVTALKVIDCKMGFNVPCRFSQYFSHNGIKLGLFDDGRVICDGEKAIFESKGGKENDNMFFYFRFRFRIQKFNAISK